MRTIAYIDGFNLYYGSLKGTAFKWLNIESLLSSILQPRNTLVEVNYFTARVRSTPSDPGVSQRQDVYLRALQEVSPNIKIRYGHFLRHRVRMANTTPPPNTVEVWKTEEKGSDVNLAVHLLNDAWLDRYDCAVVLSNDSDMAESMRLVKLHHSNKVIGLLTPGSFRTSQQLKENADFVRTIRPGALSRSQLPSPLPGTNIHKPPTW